MINKTIVSLADSNYFDLLNELVNSIKRFSESEDVDICILDAGLTDEQISILSKKGLETELNYFNRIDDNKKIAGAQINLKIPLIYEDQHINN